MIKKKNAPDIPMIDRKTRPNWKLVYVHNRVYMNQNSRDPAAYLPAWYQPSCERGHVREVRPSL